MNHQASKANTNSISDILTRQRRLPTTSPCVEEGWSCLQTWCLAWFALGHCHCLRGIASGGMCSLRMWYPGGIGWQVAGLLHLGSNSRGKH